jgi:hypothetical protein
MSIQNHVFHTKHDFTLELGWAAFQLLAEIGPGGIKPTALLALAKAVASLLTKRSALNKLLAAMLEVGLVERTHEEVRLSRAGEALAVGIGRYETGFCIAVHCLYAWKWIWDGDVTTASPSWSYREVLRQILAAGSTGIDADEIVLRVVATAERFDTVQVSFSRSSASGVTIWLASQALPLIKKKGQRIFLQNSSAPLADSVRLHVAALCALGGGEAMLNDENRQLLAESFLIGADEWVGLVTDVIRDYGEFLFIPTVPSRVIFKGSEDPFIIWMVKSARRNAWSTADGKSNLKGHNGFVPNITRRGWRELADY